MDDANARSNEQIDGKSRIKIENMATFGGKNQNYTQRIGLRRRLRTTFAIWTIIWCASPTTSWQEQIMNDDMVSFLFRKYLLPTFWNYLFQ